MNGQVIDGEAKVLDQPKALVPMQPARTMMRPLESPKAIVEAWREFQDLKRDLLDETDYQQIQGKSFPKKSAWRKLAAAFGIDCTIVAETRREIDGKDSQAGYFVWEITARAAAPSGRCMEATGSCASTERRFSHPDHDIRGTAETRAKNRAIADLVGGGEVSAEEVDHASLAETKFWENCKLRFGLDRHNDDHIRTMFRLIAAAVAAQQAEEAAARAETTAPAGESRAVAPPVAAGAAPEGQAPAPSPTTAPVADSGPPPLGAPVATAAGADLTAAQGANESPLQRAPKTAPTPAPSTDPSANEHPAITGFFETTWAQLDMSRDGVKALLGVRQVVNDEQAVRQALADRQLACTAKGLNTLLDTLVSLKAEAASPVLA